MDRWQFLLTHPVWDVTYTNPAIQAFLWNFYSHIPCGMWREPKSGPSGALKFLLTHPVWDVTNFVVGLMLYIGISTHTSRVGCDPDQAWPSQPPLDFYSHIPCGMWRSTSLSCSGDTTISTHTSRVGCDVRLESICCVLSISTHTSRVGCDDYKQELPNTMKISTHTSRVGCDLNPKGRA